MRHYDFVNLAILSVSRGNTCLPFANHHVEASGARTFDTVAPALVALMTQLLIMTDEHASNLSVTFDPVPKHCRYTRRPVTPTTWLSTFLVSFVSRPPPQPFVQQTFPYASSRCPCICERYWRGPIFHRGPPAPPQLSAPRKGLYPESRI